MDSKVSQHLLRTDPSAISWELTGRFYEAVMDDTQWEPALRQFADLMGAQSSVLMMLDTGMPGAQPFHQVGNDPAAVVSYKRYYSMLDPLVGSLPLVSPGQWVVDRADAQGVSDDVREYHHDFLGCQGVAAVEGALVARSGNQVSTISVQRAHAADPALLAERQRLAAPLMPHLERAVRLHFQMSEMRLRENVLALTLDTLRVPVMVVDAQGTIHCINARAEAILADPDAPFLCHDGRLLARHQGALVHHAIAAACAVPGISTTVRLAADARARVRGVTVVPLGGTLCRRLGRNTRLALLIISETRLLAVGDAQILSALFDLTPAEARTVIALMQGLSVKAVADRLQVEVSTVRSHLKSAFAKVGCASQANLVGICGSVLGDSPSIDSRASAARKT
jgi:DNA-binding CsgD family transcriptional regulator